MTILDIYNYIKKDFEKKNIEQIFNELLNNDYHFFDIQLGYFKLLNELNSIDIDDKKLQLKNIRADYEFKKKVKEYYNESCVISGADFDECSICHIKPFYLCNDDEKYDPCNGIILSESLHRLFDKYYFTINPNTFKIIISNEIKNKKLLINKYNNNLIIDLDINSKKYLEYHYNYFIQNNIKT